MPDQISSVAAKSSDSSRHPASSKNSHAVEDGLQETALRAALDAGLLSLLRLPAANEKDFREHTRQRAAKLMRQSLYGIIALYLLVVIPLYLLGNDDSIGLWILYSMLPIGLVLAGMWTTTRLPDMDRHIETTLCISLFGALVGTVYCAMLLGDAFFGQMASYMTIYILIIAFSILQLPAHLAFVAALLACAVALACALLQGLRPYWLEVMLYFGVPLMICTVNGYILELSERRNFVQQLLMGFESQRLNELRQRAETETKKQQRHTEYLELISGNPSTEDLFSRTLAFLISHCGAQVAAAYIVRGEKLLRVATWAGAADALEKRKQVELNATIMGPALQRGDIMRIDNLRADYLPLRAGAATLASASLMVVPLQQNSEGLAVIELGKLERFSDEDCAIADAIRTHLGYAVLAARVRDDALSA